MEATKAMWLNAGQFHCDDHKPIHCIPFFFAPLSAECAECSNGALASFLKTPQCEYFIPRGEEDGEECGATAVGINPSLEIPCCKKHVEAE
jgi:hypothetical protein